MDCFDKTMDLLKEFSTAMGEVTVHLGAPRNLFVMLTEDSGKMGKAWEYMNEN